MNYFEHVYLARMNKDGNSIQERVINSKERKFLQYVDKSIYRVQLAAETADVPATEETPAIPGTPAVYGTLQPVKENEKIITYQLLTPKSFTLATGTELILNQSSWLVVFNQPAWDKGYNKYKVYQLNREFSWWSKARVAVTQKVSFCGNLDSDIEDVYRKIAGKLGYREADNIVHIIMPYKSTLEVDCYGKINASDRRFIVVGYDIETVPGVMFVSLNLAAKRNDNEQTQVPDSFWGVA